MWGKVSATRQGRESGIAVSARCGKVLGGVELFEKGMGRGSEAPGTDETVHYGHDS